MKNRNLMWRVGLFSFLVIFLNLAAWEVGRHGYLSHFEQFTTNVAAWVICLFGIEASVSGTIILLPKETWLVNTECTALFVMIIFASFVLVYPARLREKVVALTVGVPLIFSVNILRFLVLAWLYQSWAPYATLFHDYIWQVFFIILVVLFWLIWVEKVVECERKAIIRS